MGCGFTGALQAINLHRHEGPRATIVEPQPLPGGLAYCAADPTHLLNVRASRMSAFPDEPDHLVQWLERRGVADAAAAFVPRLLYGEYLRELLEQALSASRGKLQLVRGTVRDIGLGRDCEIRLDCGRSIETDAVVLAIGNLPPHAPAGLDEEALPDGAYVGDPWSSALVEGLEDKDTVVILGTGLTMVDIALLLDKSGFRGRIVALSRRGLLPHVHEGSGDPGTALSERPKGPPSALVRQVRRRAGEIGWREAVDELRPFTQAMWRRASAEDQRRFLRHLRPWWDIHRHRIAPQVASAIQRMRDEGRLQVLAGTPLSFVPGQAVEVSYRPRGSNRVERLHARRVVNCTGPQGDLLRSTDPLLRQLLARGLIRPDAHRLGIDVDTQSRTVDAAGKSNQRLFAAGPITRGAFWEIVAVPDIRTQTWSLARRMSNAHWVGGEGL